MTLSQSTRPHTLRFVCAWVPRAGGKSWRRVCKFWPRGFYHPPKTSTSSNVRFGSWLCEKAFGTSNHRGGVGGSGRRNGHVGMDVDGGAGRPQLAPWPAVLPRRRARIFVPELGHETQAYPSPEGGG